MTFGFKKISFLLLISGLYLESVAMDPSNQSKKSNSEETVFKNTNLPFRLQTLVCSYLDKNDWVLKQAWNFENNITDVYLKDDHLVATLDTKVIKIIDLKTTQIYEINKKDEWEKSEREKKITIISQTRYCKEGRWRRFLITPQFEAEKGMENYTVTERSTGNRQSFYTGLEQMLNTFNISPDGNFFIFATFSIGLHNCYINIGNTRDSKKLSKIGINTNPTALAMSPDSKYLLAGLNDNRIFLFEVSTKKHIATLQEALPGWNIRSLAFSQDGTYIVAGDANGKVKLWQNYEAQLRNNIANSNQATSKNELAGSAL